VFRLSFFSLVMLSALLALAGCAEAGSTGQDDFSDRTINVVATTTMIRDAVEQVGGERVEVESLMGPGVDPHAYRARESDVAKMSGADVIFYNGLHLEGRMADVLDEMGDRVRTVAVAEAIDSSLLLAPDPEFLGEDFEGDYDPHVWFDVSLWKLVVEEIRDTFVAMDPDHEEAYSANAERYLVELDELDEYTRQRIDEIPEEQRVLITAHDAFAYLGHAYGLDVRGLQPITTVVEAGAADVRELADFIVEREIRAIFLETAVPPQGIMAVREAVQARGFDVAIGGELYGDALGAPDTPEGTYIGAFRHNINTIVDALTNAG
jgi:manganese/zinc/iron transport system substrate-binding protein